MALLFPFSRAFADGSAVSVQEAIRTALEKNNLLKAAEFEHRAAKRDVAISRSHYLPRLYLEETAAASNAPTRTFMMKLDEGRFTQNDFLIDNLNHPDSHADFRTGLSLELPLMDFRIGRGVEMARTEERARGYALERRRQEVAFMVYDAYLSVKKARAYLTVANQAVLDAREHQRLAKVRSDAGVGLYADELRARTFLSEMEERQISATNDLELARLRLGRAMGLPAGAPADVSEEITVKPLGMNEARFVALALESRQDLKEMAAGTEKAAAGVKLARSAYLPTLYGSATYQMNDRDIPFGRDNDSWMVAANLRWDIFDGLSRENEVGKARLTQQAADEYLENSRREVVIQVKEAYLRREEAGKRLEVARHAVLDSEEVVRLMDKRFENSIATMVEVIDAQTALNQARAHLVENENNYALATARLYEAAGVFLKEVMQ